MDRREFIKATGVAVGAISIAGCTSQNSTSGQSPEISGTAIAMVMTNGRYSFDPIGLFVKPGETVTWVNETGAHSTTAYERGNGPALVRRIPRDAKAWNSGTLSELGATFEHTFEVEGTYDYYCIPHKSLGMVGRIVVGKPGGPAEGSMPPDGTVPKSSSIVERESISYDEFMNS
jgi:plastocyanin